MGMINNSINNIYGVIVPMFTPFLNTGEIDYSGIREMMRYFKDRKRFVSALFPRSGVGRMHLFNFKEVKEIIKITTEESEGLIPILPATAGIYDGNPQNVPDPQRYIEETIELSKFAEEKGAFGVVIVTPVALKIKNIQEKEEIIFSYYKKVSSSLNLPIIVYRPPGINVNYDITPSLLNRLIQLNNIKGIKYSTKDLNVFKNFMKVIKGGDFLLICGDETVFFYGLEIGARGVIGGGCNVYPQLLRYVYEKFCSGDYTAAEKAQLTINSIIKEVRHRSFTLMGKLYMVSKGYNLQVFDRLENYELPKEEEIKYFVDLIDEKIRECNFN